MFDVLIIATGFLLAVQIVLALGSLWERRKLGARFGYPLGSRMTNASLLETYSRVVRPLNIRVNAKVPGVATVLGDLLLVNQRHVYRKDLYVTCYTLWLIKLSAPEHLHLQQSRRWQGILFSLECVFFMFAIFTTLKVLALPAVVIAVALFGYAYVLQLQYANLMETYLEYAQDLLNLDQVELARAERLAQKIKTETFAYPFLPLKWLAGFLNPF